MPTLVSSCGFRFICLTFSIVELQLQSSIKARPISIARSADIWLQGAFSVPDWIIPREASPFVTGDNRCKLTALPPADSPNNVIRSGFPPNALALSFSQRIASAWSHSATLPDQSKDRSKKREFIWKEFMEVNRIFLVGFLRLVVTYREKSWKYRDWHLAILIKAFSTVARFNVVSLRNFNYKKIIRIWSE